jgi:PAS domain S-box-containing protein
MKKKQNDLDPLRKKAEKKLREQEGRLKDLSALDTKRLVHELGTYQIELEMQNEELRMAQAELETSRNRYADLYDFAPIGYFIFDNNSVIREANLTVANLLGIEKRLLTGKTFSLFVLSEDRKIFTEHIADVMSKQVLQTCEIRVGKKDRSVFHALIESIAVEDETGELTLCRSAVSDVTDRKKAQEALRKAYDDLEIRVQERTKELRELNGTLEQRVAERTAELLEINKTLRDSRRATLNIMEDLRLEVAERKRAEESLKKSQAELQMLNRDLETYSYTVSHELKAPLRSIEGFSTALMEDYAKKLDKNGKSFCNRIVAASTRMSQQIDSLLTMSRLTQGELKEKAVDLSDMAEVIAYELKKSQPMREVEFIIAEKVKVLGDFDMLRIVMENLLANAWKFTSKTEKARIELGVMQSKPPLNPLLDQGGELVDSENSPPKLGGVAKGRGGEIIYFVRDNGAGFDMTYADKLFAPFKRLHSDSEFPGLGIGLAIVDKIVSKHGGKIWAESEIGKGTTVYFTL